jgi:hypothetical protein
MNEQLSLKSYQLQNGKWVPRVLVRTYLPNQINEQTFNWEDKNFATKKEADEFAKRKIEQS